MTTYAFPSIAPNVMSIQIADPGTARYTAETSGAIQTVTRAAQVLILSMSFTNLTTSERGELIGFLAKLRGGRHRFSIHNYSEANRGNFSGIPVVKGANQVGNTVDVDGCSINVTNWIKAGDWFQLGDELKVCTDDAASDGSGEVTISFAPSIRTSPSDNSAIVAPQGKGIFILAEGGASYSNRPGIFSDFTIEAIEDVRA